MQECIISLANIKQICADQYLAISSLCAVQSLMYSSCSFMRCLITPPPGPVTAVEAGLAAVPGLEPRCGAR